MEEMGCWSTTSVWQGHVLLTARLKLRPIRETDAPRMVELLNHENMVRLMANIPFPFTEADALSFIQTIESQRQRRQGVGLVMEETLSGQMIGLVGFGLDSKTPELGYWVGQDYWNKGFAVEAVRRLTRHLFQDLGFEYLWASTHPENMGSQAVLAKLGASLANYTRTGMQPNGQAVNMKVFELSRDDWAKTHAARPQLFVVAAALLDVDGRVLMATRPPGKMMSGLWEFPGGKVAAGETPEQALIRELAEELGVDVGESCLAPLAFASFDYDHFHLIMPLYVVRQWKGEVTAREGQSLRWVTPHKMSSLPMPPADIPLVALLRDWL